jgi:hypothetical protein
MLKYKFVYNNTEKNIQLPLISDFDFIKSNNFISEENLVDDNFIDLEITKYSLSSNVEFIFRFFNGSIYNNSFISAGFTTDEIEFSVKSYTYSYFLIQIYDTFDSKNQTLIHTGYIPIYLFTDKTQSVFNIQPNIKYYEFNNIYIPNTFNIINNQILYTKFSFFNAKTGRLQLFFNQSFNDNTEEKIYYKITVNKNNKTYSFNNSNIISSQFLNEEFINKINERNKTENKSPLFTQGDLFDINGDYI